ncbi:mannose-1-phosphate guanylyltransferase/mannose-6-phosphate isomerase [Paraburkholderia sp. Cy-641]|uniref:mannose-1-phosphate guanylyltransferase/mannose-6-phosphate isomerase n=1 Tax=Paraburkholderia sp. Cy-641 TaxID=2608337 RepID=UPI001423904F|nr:mannose-1-phosphate guanylyltransferase/mannose-6-phosphate isomerase [Paraburkholderia sp. Cy-641]NIF76626.1 mannose-1-phosphate guanylyltransferase/mannose-6-phosphate isomerase [Paraburkholderia sp. Cy-641]
MNTTESAGAKTKLIPVIVCGGSGTRLWPVSREAFPKPFMRMADGRSLLQKAYLRACALSGVDEIVIVTNRDTHFLVKDDCAEVKVDGVQLGLVLEPAARNTSAAIAAATYVVKERHGDDVALLVMPADQLVEDEPVFQQAVTLAVNAATTHGIVVFGIQPNRPETGYGYIELAEQVSSSPALLPGKRFVEKPNAEVAQRFLDGGRHLWNAGMFCFMPQTMLNELTEWEPEVCQLVSNAIEKGTFSVAKDSYTVELEPELFRRVKSVSIDYAVMERLSNVAVVACDLGWSDIGSWKSMSELTPADSQGNRIEGVTATLYDVTDCYIRGGGRVIGALGVRDLVIVDTPDALLVASRDRAEDVKEIVAQLKRDSHESCTLHRTVHRPWGTYTVLEEGERFKMKRLLVKPGASLSLQMHHHRSEHWIVVQGCADVVCDEMATQLQPNESTYIPAGRTHRLSNPGVVDLIVIEVQCGEYLGEDDIVRFEDVYGRLNAQNEGSASSKAEVVSVGGGVPDSRRC